MASAVGQVLSLFKLRIGVAITMSALTGLAVTPGPAPALWEIAVLALAVLAASASAGAFNHYAERDLDARMARTRNRPFVTGTFRPGRAWLVAMAGLLAAAVGGAAATFNAAVAAYLFLGAFVYGIVYTVWLKRRTWLNIVFGGLSGSFAVLAGAAAIDPGLTPAPILLAVVLFLWTPPHFWSLATVLHKDYAEAGVPMLPVVVGDAACAKVILGHTVALVAVSFLPAAFGLGPAYVAGAALGGGYFIYRSLRLVRAPGRPAAMQAFLASLVQLTLLSAGAMVDAWVLG